MVYHQQTLAPPVLTAQESGYEGGGEGNDEPPPLPKPRRLKSRFKEHMSDRGSLHSRTLSANDAPAPAPEQSSPAHSTKNRARSPGPGKVWYKDGEGTPTTPENRNPFTGMSIEISLIKP